MFAGFNWQQMISAFIVLFAVIDIIGSIPIIINLKEKGKDVNAMKATVISFALLIGFFYAGDMMLRLFHVDIESFAVAGAFVIFLMSLEMILDIEIFKNQGPIKEATLVPLVFPLLAGAGAFTTLLSLRAEYASVNIIIALVLNMIWVYFVVSMTGRVERFLGKGGIYIIRKFFGIILLAISVRLFTANITLLISAFIVLFAVIDIIGSIPIIINLKEKGKEVNALKATLISFALLIGFFYAGDMMLKLFHVDIESFAVAGAFVIFLMSLEMILDIEIFKNQGPIKEATLVPLVFPLLAGAGAFTTLLSLRAEYASVNIIIALVLNMIWVYFVVSMTGRVERFLGKGGIYIIRKFFGIILLAISVRLFMANITLLVEALHKT